MKITPSEKSVWENLKPEHFILSKTDYDKFLATCDNPPGANGKLRALMNRIPIWDRK